MGTVANDLLELLLPNNDNCDDIIMDVEDIPNGFSFVVRSKINTKEEVLSWFKEFQKINYLTFRVLQTFEENTPKIVFKKTYRCVHNTRPKRGVNACTKHTGCTAKVALTLKNRNVKRTKDIYLKTHPCEIYVRHTHNHDFLSASILKYRSPSDEVIEIFKGLFRKGLSPSASLRVFKENLLEQNPENYEEIIADGYKCPTQKWAYDLYYKTFNCKVTALPKGNIEINEEISENDSMTIVPKEDNEIKEERSENDSMTIVPKEDKEIQDERSEKDSMTIVPKEDKEIQEERSDKDSVVLENLKNGLNDIFENLLNKAQNNLNEYEKPLDAFIKRYNSCKTDSSLISALYKFGKYNGAGAPIITQGKGHQGSKTIGVQPTAISRQKHNLSGQYTQRDRPPKRLRRSDREK